MAHGSRKNNNRQRPRIHAFCSFVSNLVVQFPRQKINFRLMYRMRKWSTVRKSLAPPNEILFFPFELRTRVGKYRLHTANFHIFTDHRTNSHPKIDNWKRQWYWQFDYFHTCFIYQNLTIFLFLIFSLLN